MFNLKNEQITQLLVIVGVTILLIFLVKTYYFDTKVHQPVPTNEGFYNYDESSPVMSNSSSMMNSQPQQTQQPQQFQPTQPIIPEQKQISLHLTPDQNLQMFKCKDSMKCTNAACNYFHHPKFNFEESR